MKSVVVVIALLLGACGGGVGAVQVTAEDAGTTIDVGVGDTVEVVLEGNITTGFEWIVESVDEAVLRPAESSDYTSDAPPDVAGAGGFYTWSFEAVDEGTTTVELVYVQPWEDVEPAETFAVTVRVGP